MTVHECGRKGIAFLLALTMLNGCGFQPDGHGGAQAGNTNFAGMETEPVLSYEVPSSLPGVFVNRRGYCPNDRKTAIFQGKTLPKQFQIVDASTEEVVHTGRVEPESVEEETGIATGYGDFSNFTKEGEYYILCDKLGFSYAFSIRETLHDELLSEGLALLSEKIKNVEKEQAKELCDCMATLLLSCELYGTVYKRSLDKNGLPTVIGLLESGAGKLLDWQDEETGALLLGETPSVEETAWLAAVLAKFSYTYQKYDSVYATACLQAADRALRFLESKKEETKDCPGLLFFAAAEMYRATGKYEYRAKVEQLGKALLPDARAEAQTFGTLTYAATKRRVDVKLCGTLLKVILDEAEAIAERAKENVFRTGSSMERDSVSGVLWDAVIVAAVDYVITNSEYAALLENYQNYVAGANEKAAGFVFGEEKEPGIGESLTDTARYLMMLSEIMSHEEE